MPLPVIKDEYAEIKRSAIAFEGFSLGLNTSVPANQIRMSELAECVNWKINKGGQLESRDSIIAHTTGTTTSNSSVKFHDQLPIGGTSYELVVDANYKLYYKNAANLTSIGTLEGETQIIAYNGVAVVFDGSFIKYLDGVGAENLKIAYDDGTGTSGYQYNNKSGDDDSSLVVGNGTNERVAVKFTSQSWTTGYTIPPTKVTVKLSKTLTPTGSMLVKIRLVSDDSVLASKTLVDVATLTGTAAESSVTFTSSDITTELSRNVSYYLSFEYGGGDGTNYVNIHCSDVASGGVAFHYAAASWSADATKNPIASLRPGMPPKAAFGRIADGRIFAAGDPDNKGYVWFCNLTHLDWSTSDGGGYVGAVDGNANNFEVGGIESLYDDLYVYGTEDQAYLCKLSGSSPSDFELPRIFQKVWTNKRCITTGTNDVWSLSGEGVDPLSGVQEYGDLRTFSASDSIEDRIRDYWNSSTSFVAYNSKAGQLWIVTDHHRVLVCHTKIPVQSPDSPGSRYPWSEYELYRDVFTSTDYKWTASSVNNEYYMEITAGGDPSISVQPDFVTLEGNVITEGTAGSLQDHEWDYGDNDALGYSTIYFRDDSGDPDVTGVEIRSVLIPTSLSNFGNEFYIGGSDGLIKKLSATDYKDLTTIQFTPKFRTSYVEMPMVNANLDRYQLLGGSKFGAFFDFTVYRNGLTETPALTKETIFPISDVVTIDDLSAVDVSDALFAVDPQGAPVWHLANIKARSFQIRIWNVQLIGAKLYFNGCLIYIRPLRG